jgi:DNA-directed RNA polymerase subunit beta
MRELKRFGSITEVIDLPNLTNIQISSYDAFLQKGSAPVMRADTGLQAAFREIFPIDETERGRQTGLVLDFLEYSLQEPEFDPDECREKDLSYQAGLFAKLQLVHKDTGLIKEDQVFLGDLPLMTEDGSFVINGADRVIVSQIHRSPGVYFTGVQHGVNRRLTASIIPMPKRGPWIEIEFDSSDVLWMKVNKRKFPFTLLLRVLGHGDEADPGAVPRLRVAGRADPPSGGGQRGHERRGAAAPVHGAAARRPPEGRQGHELPAQPAGRPAALRPRRRRSLQAQRQAGVVVRTEDAARLRRRRLHDYGLIPTLQYLVRLQAGEPGFAADDIDHLGNRRIRTVGELVADQIRVGLGRMARGVRERMLLGNPDAATPQKLVNNRPIVAALREFFGRSQLSQFKDQVNPLSELRHKRRISALGPGGLTRERAGFDVRDVHRTHYGRICPIETPEGANIGLITSLASYSRVNELGFIEAPYRRVRDQIVTDEVVYMTAHDEDRYIIAQANTPLDDDGRFATTSASWPASSATRSSSRPKQSTSWTCPRSRSSRSRLADPVPRARRRQPRADGLEHAVAGGAADPQRGAVRRHRRRGARRARLRHRRPGARGRHGSLRRRDPRGGRERQAASSAPTCSPASSARTRTPTSTSVRSSRSASASRPARCSPTVPPPTSGGWRSGRTS